MTRIAHGTVLFVRVCSAPPAAGVADGGRGVDPDAGLAADGGAEAEAPRPPLLRLPPRTTFYWQIAGVIDPARAEAVYDVDLFDAAPEGSYLLEPGGKRIPLPPGKNPGIVGALHAKGKKVICRAVGRHRAASALSAFAIPRRPCSAPRLALSRRAPGPGAVPAKVRTGAR